MNLAGKTAIVTGGSNGIGRAIARALASHGASIGIMDIDRNNGVAIVAELESLDVRSLFHQADVSAEDEVRKGIDLIATALSGLHVLVNNAGIRVFETAESATEASWNRCMDVDLKSVWLCSKHAIPHLRAAKGGSIINIASTHAYRTQPGSFPYAVAKGGVTAMTRAMAVDLGKDSIRVNSILPGLIETGLTQEWMSEFQKPDMVMERVLSLHPLGRLGAPEDVANTAVFLAADESSFLTGIEIIVDGGRNALTQNLSDLYVWESNAS